jgi:hypothetical protein
VLDVDLKFPRAFSIFPLPLRTSIKENWEADLLVSLFDPVFDTEPHKTPHYSIRSLDANDDVVTVHGHAFASLQKTNFELMRLVLGDRPRVWKAVTKEPGSENPEFVRAQNVAGLKASKTGSKAIGWGFDSAGCLAFWEREGGGKAVLTGLFVQRMRVQPEVEVEVKEERD